MEAEQQVESGKSTYMECDYLYGWMKKRSQTQNSYLKMVNPRIIAGNAEEEEEESG